MGKINQRTAVLFRALDPIRKVHWLVEKDDLSAGRTPRPKTGELTVKRLADRFLTGKRHLLDTRELSPVSFKDYDNVWQRNADVLGKDRAIADLKPEDCDHLRVEFATTHGPFRLPWSTLTQCFAFHSLSNASIMSANVFIQPEDAR